MIIINNNVQLCWLCRAMYSIHSFLWFTYLKLLQYITSTHYSKHLQISGKSIDETLPQIISVSLHMYHHIRSPFPLSNVVCDSLIKAYLGVEGLAKGLFTHCDLSCRFVGPKKSWSKSARVNGDLMRARFQCDMSADSETSAAKSRHYTCPLCFCPAVIHLSMRITWNDARTCCFSLQCFFWWKAMRTKATICCVSSSILLLAAASKCFKKRKRRKRTVWVKDWLLQRESKGAFNQIFEELRVGDPASFQNYVRMNTETFEVSAQFRNNLFSQYFWTPFKIFMLVFLYLNLFELIESVASL